MKRIRALAAAAAIAAGLSIAAADTVEPPDALVADAMDAPSHVSYEGTIETIQIGRTGSQASILRVEHRAPDRTRTDYSAPSSVNGDSLVVVGDRSFEIDALRKRVVRSENADLADPALPAANYLLLRKNYTAVGRPDETRAGHPVNAVAFRNVYTHRTIAIVDVDRTTKLILDKQLFAANGSLISEMRFIEVRYPKAIPDSDFAVPSGYESVDAPSRAEASQAIPALLARSDFPARCPMTLEHGFAAVDGKFETIQGVRTLHVFFSDGLRTVSLFESGTASSVDLGRFHPQATTVGTQTAQYGLDGPTTLLVWSDGTRRYALVGELDLNELQRIAQTLSS